jgi:hypothetical protein
VINSDSGYLETHAEVEPGNCYYINVYDEAHEQVSTSYIDHEEITVEPGETVSLIAKTWVGQPSYSFWAEGMNGKVYCGTSLDALTDTGVTAVDGAFTLPFNEAGDYYEAFKADGAAAAYAVVHVALPRRPQRKSSPLPRPGGYRRSGRGCRDNRTGQGQYRYDHSDRLHRRGRHRPCDLPASEKPEKEEQRLIGGFLKAREARQIRRIKT